MTKKSRFLGTCLLIGTMATVAWAGEIPGTGSPSPEPTPPAETNSTSTLASVQDASATAEVVNVLITWLVETIL
jgi:hypothetical protein